MKHQIARAAALADGAALTHARCKPSGG